MAGTTLIGTAGTREGVELGVHLNSSGVVHVNDGRLRMLQGWSLDRTQAQSLAGLLTRAATAEPPPPDPTIETFQTGDDAA
jgi:hypothetical protein